MVRWFLVLDFYKLAKSLEECKIDVSSFARGVSRISKELAITAIPHPLVNRDDWKEYSDELENLLYDLDAHFDDAIQDEVQDVIDDISSWGDTVIYNDKSEKLGRLCWVNFVFSEVKDAEIKNGFQSFETMKIAEEIDKYGEVRSPFETQEKFLERMRVKFNR